METLTEKKDRFTDEERMILDAEYLKAHVDRSDIKAKIKFWQNKDGVQSSIHYMGMGYDDEETQDKTVLPMYEAMFLMECGYYKEDEDFKLA